MSYLKSISGMPLLRGASAALVIAFVAAHLAAIFGAVVWWMEQQRRSPLCRRGREARGIVLFTAVLLPLTLIVLSLLHLGFITIDK